MDRVLEIQDLTVGYGRERILSGLNLVVRAGEVVALLGPSGSGKTTLLRCIAGLLEPHAGFLRICGQPAEVGNPDVAYMVQEDLLLPWRNILSNTLLSVELRQGIRGRISQSPEARRFLRELGLQGYEERYPHELSGGMRQRVALARTLLLQGRLYLLDEPFGALDLIRREQLYDLLLQHTLSPTTGLLIVTHDLRDALRLADRIVVLTNGTITGQVHSTDPHAESLIRELLREATCPS
jgi:NitT/TauT family transport system ATP-binding protein